MPYRNGERNEGSLRNRLKQKSSPGNQDSVQVKNLEVRAIRRNQGGLMSVYVTQGLRL